MEFLKNTSDKNVLRSSMKRDRSESTNLGTIRQTSGSQSETNEESGPIILCKTQEKPCTSTGNVEKGEKISMTDISRRKSLNSSVISTPIEIQGGLFECTHYELNNSKKKMTKGKLKVNLFIDPVEEENSSSKLEETLFRSKYDSQIFRKFPESRRFFYKKQIRNEYAIIRELSEVLPCLRSDKHLTEDDLVQNEKHLLVSTEKVKLYNKNITNTKDETEALSTDVIVVQISKILIALKSENERIYNNAHFICLICTEDEIFPTKLVRLITIKETKCVRFEDLLEFQIRDNEFKISIKIYSYQRRNPNLKRCGLLKFLPKIGLAYPVQICCENMQTDNIMEEVLLLPVFKQCAEFTISKENFPNTCIRNFYPDSIFHDFGLTNILLKR